MKGKRIAKLALMLTMLVMILTAGTGSTLAYLAAHTDAVENEFDPAHVDCEVTETFDGTVKRDVCIKNTGDIDAYIRAAVVVTWQDADGNVYGEMPKAGTDYTISWTKSGWTEKSGYFYHQEAVTPGASTGELFTDCQVVEGRAPAGYHLSVEILAQAIQFVPETAVENSWGVTVTDGKISG